MTDRPTAEQRREPRTAAGRALLDDVLFDAFFEAIGSPDSRAIQDEADLAARIAAVEAEASREAEGLLRRVLVNHDLAPLMSEAETDEWLQAREEARAYLAAREKEERS